MPSNRLPTRARVTTRALLAASMSCSLLAAGDTRAQVYQWNGSVGSQWIDGLNWTPAGPPAAGSTALFGAASNYTVDMGGALRSVLAADLVSGQSYAFTNGDLFAFDTRITTAPSAWVNLDSTSFLVAASSFRLGISESGTTSGGNLITTGGSLYVGNAANTGAANSIIISDSTSGAVLLNVRHQSQLTHSGTTILGDAAGSQGRIFVSDASTHFVAGSNFYVGFSGSDVRNATGIFDSLNLAMLDAGLRWHTSDLYTDGGISVVDLILGDMDGDGALNNADIAPFVLSLTDPDGYASVYPEPTSLALLALGGVLLTRRRRSR